MNHLKWMGHSATIFDIQKGLKSDPGTCDVTLVGNGISAKAHRFVLSSSSDLLRDLLCNIPVGDEATIVIPDINGSLLDCVLSFIYIGETSLTSANISDFLEVISILGIKSTISFECANSVTERKETAKAKKKLKVKIEENLMETDIEPEIDIQGQAEEQASIENSKDGNESQKVGYSFRSISANDSNEDTETVAVPPNAKNDDNSVNSSDSHEENAEEECEENEDDEESGQVIEDYVTTHPLMEQFDRSPHSAAVVVQKTDENIGLTDSKMEYKSYIHFDESQAQRNKSLESATSAVVDLGMSLQKAAQKFNISKTVLWRRVQKHPLYIKTQQENPILATACKRLQTGESLKSISLALDIPMSTLHRNKVRLAQEGRLPKYVILKKRDPLAKTVLKHKLEKAVKACVNEGMSQNHAANLYDVPKSTLWRHLQKEISSGELITDIKEEIILP